MLWNTWEQNWHFSLISSAAIFGYAQLFSDIIKKKFWNSKLVKYNHRNHVNPVYYHIINDIDLYSCIKYTIHYIYITYTKLAQFQRLYWSCVISCLLLFSWAQCGIRMPRTAKCFTGKIVFAFVNQAKETNGIRFAGNQKYQK